MKKSEPRRTARYGKGGRTVSIWKDLQRKAAEGLAKASQETQRQVQATRIRVQLLQLRQRRAEQHARLGETVYAAWKAGQLPDGVADLWQPILTAIRDLEGEEQSLRDTLGSLGAEEATPGRCPSCGAPVGEGSHFCPQCGAPLA
jgi:hypothetical protein